MEMFFIEGRIKRMMVRPDGHNVFPSAIEEVICAHDAVKECAVIGVQSNEYRNCEIPAAFVVLKKEMNISGRELEKQLRELSAIKLPPRDVALEYRFFDKIPMTPVGKLDYRKLEQWAKKKVR